MTNRSTNYHNQGQADAAHSRYSPPHDLLEQALTFGKDHRDNCDDNRSYNEGWRNHVDNCKK
jgi:hypothetical protein